jgi:hypothetical protein
MQPISVCMSYWKRRGCLERSLEAYARVYPSWDIEFSICDDGSPENPLDIPGAIITTLPRKRYGLNPCVPINAAIRASTHDIIVLTNPEIEHELPVLKHMLWALRTPRDYVQALCVDRHRGEFTGPGAPRAPSGGRQPLPPGVWSPFCVMFHRELFERAGGFDESFRNGIGCEDNDWSWKLWSLGDVNFKYVSLPVWHTATPHARLGTTSSNAALLHKKWGHLEEFKKCV